VEVRLLDSKSNETARKSLKITIPGYYKKYESVCLSLPKEPGGNLLLPEFFPENIQVKNPVISRRYIMVGEADRYESYDYEVGRKVILRNEDKF